MDPNKETKKPTDRTIVVGLDLSTAAGSAEEAERSLDELADLVRAAGGEVVGRMLQRKSTTDSATYIGKGKATELKNAGDSLEADLLVFDDELSGSQIRNLEEIVGRRVVDRSMLILDIFAQRAASREGKLQVELALLQYRKSRLVGLGLALSRLGGGIGTRGPGESKLETDRRHIGRRILALKRELETVGDRRDRVRARRRSGEALVVAVAGYTNAGKTSIVNRICGSGLYAEDMPFATLDPAARRLLLEDGREIVLVDTVGFIRKLPHHLVDAFRSTLDEVAQADVVLHVVDASDPESERHMEIVEALLTDLGAAGLPRLTAYNKSDRVDILPAPARSGKNVFVVSALTGEGIDALRKAIEALAPGCLVPIDLCVPYDRAGLVDWLHGHGRDIVARYEPEGILIHGRLREDCLSDVAAYRIKDLQP
jgi:GTP-binding protein HflX